MSWRPVQKWRLRYFVLYAPPSSSSSSSLVVPVACDEQAASPLLCYYDDETLERQRGRIVLGRGSELVVDVPVTASAGALNELGHLFAVRSSARTPGHRRTYYLAAAGDDDLTAWIDSVRAVLETYGDGGGKRPCTGRCLFQTSSERDFPPSPKNYNSPPQTVAKLCALDQFSAAGNELRIYLMKTFFR